MADAAPMPKPHGSSRDLTKGPITRTLLMFSLPTLGANIIQSLNGSINAVWVGRLLGETALSATANGGLLLFFLLSAVFGFGMAATIQIAQYAGRRDTDSVRRVAGTGTTLFMGLGCLIALFGWIFAPELLSLMRTPEAAYPLALEYMRVIFIGMPPLYFLIYITMLMRGMGDSRTPFLFTILSSVLDVCLNPIFILGLFGVPAMGIAGAGWAMFVAQTTSLCGILLYIYGRDLPLRLRGAELRYLIPDPALLKAIIAKGVPMGLQMIVISFSALLMIHFVNGYGVTTTAAYGVIAQLWSYVQMPAMAVGAAVSAMAAQNIGAGHWHRVNRITQSGIVINIALTGLLILLTFIVEQPLIRLFLPTDDGAVQMARHINQVASWGFILYGITLVLFGTVRATGAVVGPLVIMAIAMFPGRIGFVLLFEKSLGADAIWWSFPAGTIAAVLLAVGYYRQGGWRKAKMLEGRKPDPDEAEDLALLPAEGAGQPPQVV